MKRSILDNFQYSPYFTLSALRQVADGTKNDAINFNVKAWMKRGDLVQLKKGVYVVRDYYIRNGNNPNYQELIANVLCYPSYVSSYYVLDGFSMLTEATLGVSSTTEKTTRFYKNPVGSFRYVNIASRLFTGYFQKSSGFGTINMATKAKALFDYLWERLGNLSPEDPNMVEELRINWEQMNAQDWVEFEKYCEMANNKMRKMFAVIKKYE
jgi:hypothetical protein